MKAAGFRIDVANASDLTGSGRASFHLFGMRGTCAASVQYYNELSKADADAQAASLGWDFPTATHQTRVIVYTSGADTSPEASRKCSDELFALVTKELAAPIASCAGLMLLGPCPP